MTDNYYEEIDRLRREAQAPAMPPARPSQEPQLTPEEFRALSQPVPPRGQGRPKQVGEQSAVEMAEASKKEEGREEFRKGQIKEQQAADAAARQQREAAALERVTGGDPTDFDFSVLPEGQLPPLTPLAFEATRWLNANVSGALATGTGELAKDLGVQQYVPDALMETKGWQDITNRAALAQGGIVLGGQAIKKGSQLFNKMFTSASRPKTLSEAAAVLPKSQLEEAVSLPGQYLIHGIRPKRGSSLPSESYVEHGLLIKTDPVTGRRRTTFHSKDNWGATTETMSASKRADSIINPIDSMTGKPTAGPYKRVVIMRGNPQEIRQPFKGSTVPGFSGGSGGTKWIPDYKERIPPENIIGVWDRSTGQFTVGRGHPNFVEKK